MQVAAINENSMCLSYRQDIEASLSNIVSTTLPRRIDTYETAEINTGTPDKVHEDFAGE